MRVFLKYFVLLVIVIFILTYNSNISIFNDDVSTITVEVRGCVNNEGSFTLPKDSTFEDILNVVSLKENADISNFSLQEPLYNKEVIVIKDDSIKLVSINSANLDELITLPGIGEKTANLIIEYRKQYGGFKYLEELKNVKGIGDAKFNKIKDKISL